MRVQLAKALLFEPIHLLLLDEPTNHLDISGISWLQRKIKKDFCHMTIVLVSHVRSFLNYVADETIVFKNQRLEYFKGNYDFFIQQQEEKAAFAARYQSKLDRKKANMQAR